MPQARAHPDGNGIRAAVLALDISPQIGGPVATSRKVVGGAVAELCGFALVETTGTSDASLVIIDGGGASASWLAPVNLAAGESAREWWQPCGLLVPTGQLFLSLISGSVAGVLFARMGR